MYLKTRALVLRVTDYNDRDALLTLLTPHNGKITAKEKALQVEITTTDYSVYSFVINGFTTEYAKSFELVIASYAISNGKAEFIQSEYALSDTPAVSMVEKNDGCLYTVSLNTVVSQNSLEKIPAYTIPTNNKDEE